MLYLLVSLAFDFSNDNNSHCHLGARSMPHYKTLTDLQPQQQGEILSAAMSRPDLQTRLYSLGLYPGARLTVLRFAPAGDPIQVRVGNTLISIRKSEADLIQIKSEDSDGE